MAEEHEGTVPKTPREKELAAKHGNKKLITHGDVMKARGIHREEAMGHAGKVTMKQVNEAEHILPMKGGDARYGEMMKHAKKMGYNVHHNEHLGDEKSGNKGNADVTVHYERGDKRDTAIPQSIEIHKGGKAHSDKALTAMVKGKASAMREGWNPIKHIPKEKQNNAIRVEGFKDIMKKIGNKVLDAVAPSDDKLVDNLHKSVHGKNAPNVPKPKPKLKLAHDYVKENVKDQETPTKKPGVPEVPEWKKKLNDPYAKEKSAFHSKQISTGTVYSRKYEEVESVEEGRRGREPSNSILAPTETGAKSVYKGTPEYGQEKKRRMDLDKHLKNTIHNDKMAYRKTQKEEVEQQNEAILKGPSRLGFQNDRFSHLNTPAKPTTPKKEEVKSVGVKHEQFGAGKTLPQFAEDLSWIDVMFDEGIKRVYVEDLELTEEKAVHPDAIHVSNAGGGKYKVHAVGSNFSHGIKVGEHLTDTHLDDFSEMGGKVKTVKAPKKD